MACGRMPLVQVNTESECKDEEQLRSQPDSQATRNTSLNMAIILSFGFVEAFRVYAKVLRFKNFSPLDMTD